MTNLKAPCYKCEKRSIGCHSDCPLYLEYRKTREKIVEGRRERVCLDSYLFDAVTRMSRKK